MGHEAVEVRVPSQLDTTDGLIIPGGESTTILKQFTEFNFREQLQEYRKNKPIMGTCAGLIVLANKVDRIPEPALGFIDITVQRNAYGRQRESFIGEVTLTLNSHDENYEAVFIRAPKIETAGPDVVSLARHNGDIIMARNRNILVCTFHPELTDDVRIHEYFISHFIINS